MSTNCHKCSKPLPDSFKVMVARSDTCPHCRADIRCCKMCQHYDVKAYNECREPSADRIVDKEKANFCDYFKYGAGGATDAEKQRQEQLAKAMSLFKK